MFASGAGTSQGRGRRRRAARRITAALLALGVGACGEDPVGADRSCGDAPALIPGDPRIGALAPGDSRLDGSLIDYYTVRTTSAGVIVLEMRSTSDVDPFLYLWIDGATHPTAQAFAPDPAAPVRVARLHVAMDSGCYTVGASTWADETGPYEILLEPDQPAP